MAKYGRGAKKRVASAMRRRKSGTLKSGSGRTVKSRKPGDRDRVPSSAVAEACHLHQHELGV